LIGLKTQRPLNVQLALRLGALLLLILICLAIEGFWIRDQVNDKARTTQLANAREHYAAVLADLDRRWGREAFNLKTRLEAQNILADVQHRTEKLAVYLISQGNSIEYPSLRIETTHGDVIAAYDYGSHIETSVKFLPGQTSAWVLNPKDGSLYLVIRQFIWLGNENGYLVLFKPMDHALLTQITYPGTRLSLWWKGKAIASSDGEEGLPRATAALAAPDSGKNTATLTWSGPESESTPKLIIEPLANELVSMGSIARPAMLAFFVLLIAITITFSSLWLRASRQAYALLQALKRHERLNTIDEHLVGDLRVAQTGPVESIRHLATAFERRLRAANPDQVEALEAHSLPPEDAEV
jgi:hypothetical protein